jgi:hypothetical protein
VFLKIENPALRQFDPMKIFPLLFISPNAK